MHIAGPLLSAADGVGAPCGRQRHPRPKRKSRANWTSHEEGKPASEEMERAVTYAGRSSLARRQPFVQILQSASGKVRKFFGVYFCNVMIRGDDLVNQCYCSMTVIVQFEYQAFCSKTTRAF